MSWLLLLFTLFITLSFSKKTPKTLVFVKDEYSKYSYSRFFKSLKRRGHKLTVKTPETKLVKLQEYGEYLFDNLIILDSSSSS